MRTLFFIISCIMLAFPLFGADVETCVRLCGELTKLQQAEAEAYSQWQEQRLLLEGEAAIARKRLAETLEALAGAQQALAASQSRMESQRQEVENARTRLQAVGSVIAAFEQSLLSRRAAMPDPLLRRLAPLLDSLAQEEMSMEAMPGRLSRLLSIHAEMTAFASGVTVVPVMLPENDGFSREYQVLYLGLAAAYGISSDGASAAIGQPGPNGWQWRFDPAWAKTIARAISMAADQSPAELAPLPMRIHKEAAP